jgi:hypothetical protein
MGRVRGASADPASHGLQEGKGRRREVPGQAGQAGVAKSQGRRELGKVFGGFQSPFLPAAVQQPPRRLDGRAGSRAIGHYQLFFTARCRCTSLVAACVRVCVARPPTAPVHPFIHPSHRPNPSACFLPLSFPPFVLPTPLRSFPPTTDNSLSPPPEQSHHLEPF